MVDRIVEKLRHCAIGQRNIQTTPWQTRLEICVKLESLQASALHLVFDHLCDDLVQRGRRPVKLGRFGVTLFGMQDIHRGLERPLPDSRNSRGVRWRGVQAADSTSFRRALDRLATLRRVEGFGIQGESF